MARASRQKAERSGRIAEWIAVVCLTLKGYQVLATRQKTHMGELDLVCLRKNLVVIVEVKRRKTVEEGKWAVSDYAWQRIGRAADFWLAKRDEQLFASNRRFDLFIVSPPFKVCHILDAWRPENPLTHG